jgi:murein DD-endopeptidase MepM/ murein hydrolase activator NlpD
VGEIEKAEGCVTKLHKGIDIGAATGKKVYAFDGGTITKVAGGCVVGDLDCNGQAGNYIAINHGNGMITRYLHLSKMYVKTGQKVSVGQLIGEVGNTGRSTGSHLHFDINVNGNYVDPESYYNFEK